MLKDSFLFYYSKQFSSVYGLAGLNAKCSFFLTSSLNKVSTNSSIDDGKQIDSFLS